MSEGSYPEELKYTTDHEWGRVDNNRLQIGITFHAQKELGDVVYVDLPAAGATVEKGQPFGEVESTKSVSDLYAPVSGTIVERNEALDEQPELVNTDPYGQGWMVTIECSDMSEVEAMMTAAAYQESL